MTQPLRSPDTPSQAFALALDEYSVAGLRRMSVAFAVGWYFFCEKLCHPIDDVITLLPFITMFGAIATAFAVLLIVLLSLPIRRVSKIRSWWRHRWWPPIAVVVAATLLWGLAWLPGLRASVEVLPTTFVDSYNRPLGFAAWLLLLFGIMNYTRRRDLIPAPSQSADGPIISEEAS